MDDIYFQNLFFNILLCMLALKLTFKIQISFNVNRTTGTIHFQIVVINGVFTRHIEQ
jgi:hypothetical protein